MLPHLWQRPATRKRWPDGVRRAPTVFFAKDLGAGTPDWVRRVTVAAPRPRQRLPRRRRPGDPHLDRAARGAGDPRAAVALRRGRRRRRTPTASSSTSTPGEGVTLAEVAEVARWARDVLRDIGHDPVPVTSGSKGIHLYAPLDGGQTPEQATARGARARARPRGGHPGPGDQQHEAQRARREGVRRLEPEQRRQDDHLAVLAARPRRSPGSPRPAPGRSSRTRTSPSSRTPRCSRASPSTATCWPRWPRPTARRAAGRRDRLSTYRSMRDAAKTPEPVPATPPRAARAGRRPDLRHPGAPRAGAALGLPPRARRRPGQLGRPQVAADRPEEQPAGRA